MTGAATCPYCVSASQDVEFNDEHVIPAKLGGTLVIRAHPKCNGDAATAIDNPLMDDPDVEMLRAITGVRNTRTGRLRGAQFSARLDDDATALVRVSPEGLIVEQVTASTPRLDSDGKFTFTLGTQAVEKQTARLLEELRKKYPGKTVTLDSQQPRKGQVTVERSWGLMPWVWPRFAAKVALGVLSLTMPPAWRGSDGEVFLLALFRLGKVIGAPDGLSAVPRQLDEGDPAFDYMYPWEHAIVVQETDEGVGVSVILFGELRYDLQTVTDLRPGLPRVWLCDHRSATP